MITTFFGAHSFGGDAAFVDRLCRALLRAGHAVHVVHCRDAFEAVRGTRGPRPYTPPPGLRIHALSSRVGRLSPLWTHQTGGPGTKRSALRRILARHRFDVVHFHNISLLGGPKVFDCAPDGAVKLLTNHEHWLVCPLSLLWKNDREVCETPRCLPCTLRAGRPPQLWRILHQPHRSLARLDAVIFPSEHTLKLQRERGVEHRRMICLPYFLPEDWFAGGDGKPAREAGAPGARPYFAAAGRLVKEKGFHDLIAAMEHLPEAELRIAGSGPFERALRARARGLDNVRLLGYLDAPALAALYRRARAVIVPSLFYETFGYVAVEAFSMGTPALVRNRGALPELIHASGAGEVYDTQQELTAAMRGLLVDPERCRELGSRARRAVETVWSERRHLGSYLALVESFRS